MKRVGALTESIPLSERAHQRRPATERAAQDVPRDKPIPWLLALIPIGLLVVAGLLTLGLTMLVAIPTIPPRVDLIVDESHGLGMPVVNEVEGDGGSLPVGPGYTR
jgi:hypothetical protein